MKIVLRQADMAISTRLVILIMYVPFRKPLMCYKLLSKIVISSQGRWRYLIFFRSIDSYWQDLLTFLF